MASSVASSPVGTTRSCPSRRASSASTHHVDRRSPTGSTTGPVCCAAIRGLRKSHSVTSARSSWSFVGRTWVDRAVVSLAMISMVASTSSCSSAGTRSLASGKAVTRLPPRLSTARMLPARISSASTAQGHSPRNACVSGRLSGPAPNVPSGGEHRELEGLHLVGEAGVEPRPAGAVHRAGDDHHDPGEPLGDVGAGRHGDARPRLHRHPPGSPHPVEQVGQVGLGDVGDARGVPEA